MILNRTPVRRLWLLGACLLVTLARAADTHVFEEAYDLQRAGKLEEAVARYEEGLAADPNNAQAHLYLGEAYRGLKEWGRAAREYQRAVDLDADGQTGQQAKKRLETLPAVSPAVAELLKSIESSMVAIPAGTFQMGDRSKSGNADELPAHKVTLHSFHLASVPVTFEQYDVYAGETARALPDDRGWGRQKHPVIGVSWDAASAFIAWLNKQGTYRYRLPSEAEWEYAARSGTDAEAAEFSGTARDASQDPDADERTRPVGQGQANAWGLYDMVGGVVEWLQDCYQEDYHGAPSDGSAWLAGDCSRRVERGGPAGKDSSALRFSTRHWHVQSFRFGLRGFRLARDE
ncbi:MAG: SUMF1/EgtB/PvdO family nonheme iron enzyme [Gammaproteobacteria bacterium]|nr:SUMF1/EgtB/PvdO family nonheme iron enzyme [Gammaproteobacteria bacterium]